jgi:hypothetical protein
MTANARRVAFILLELAIVAGVFIADVYHHIFVSKTPYLLALAWISIRMRGLRWRDVGFTRPQNLARAIGFGIAAGVAIELIELFITQPLLAHATGKMPDLSDFAQLRGNWKLAGIFLLLTWSLAAFGEELVYRGYLMNRVAELFRNTRAAWAVSLVLVNIAFGCGHIDQGATGMLENIWDGALLGGLYLATGRNLTVPIVAHGITDTIDFVLIFLGLYPGM